MNKETQQAKECLSLRLDVVYEEVNLALLILPQLQRIALRAQLRVCLKT